ncbi:FG-GAP repeat-containing protein [Ahrensia sp. R2A130]|nr:FG-GAP repeat-containing protein [Ahrensia sp. R2A130]
MPMSNVSPLQSADAPNRFIYSDPTRRYAHAVLGDDIEGGSLVAIDAETGEPINKLVLPENLVFEDRWPRAVDLDGFGKAHVVTLLSEASTGAAVAVYEFADGKLSLAAKTPAIGRANRWMNIAGIEDFDGSGSASIAVVRTPHIGGTLEFWRWSKGTLTKVAEAFGFSNHQYGSPELRLSAIEDFDDDGVSDLALPSADRRSLQLVKLSSRKNPEVDIIASVSLPSPIDKAIGVTRNGDDVVLTVGLENGSVYAIHRGLPNN